MTSIPAFADNIPKEAFISGFADYFVHMKEANRILNESLYIQERYEKGWDRDVDLAMAQDQAHFMAGARSWGDKSMFMTKRGDKGAIFAGGWSVYRYHYNKSIKEGLGEAEAKKNCYV